MYTYTPPVSPLKTPLLYTPPLTRPVRGVHGCPAPGMENRIGADFSPSPSRRFRSPIDRSAETCGSRFGGTWWSALYPTFA